MRTTIGVSFVFEYLTYTLKKPNFQNFSQQLCIWSMLQTTVFQSFPNLPFGSWPIHSENASLRESVSHLTQSRSTLQSELASTDQLLNDTRHELEELRDRLAATSRRFEVGVIHCDITELHSIAFRSILFQLRLSNRSCS